MRKELRVREHIEDNRLLLLRVTLLVSSLTVYIDAVNSKDTLPEWVIAEMMILSGALVAGGALVTASIPDWGKDISDNHSQNA